MVISLMHRYGMKDYFSKGMPGLFKSFYCLERLAEKYVPRVHKHFMEIGFIPQMYASQWFLTIFVVDFPIDTVVRIWDMFFIEGRKVIYRIALAIFKLLEKKLVDSDLMEIFEFINRFKSASDINTN